MQRIERRQQFLYHPAQSVGTVDRIDERQSWPFQGDDTHSLGARFGHFLCEAAAQSALFQQNDVGLGHRAVFVVTELVVGSSLFVGQCYRGFTAQDAVDDTNAPLLQSLQSADALYARRG